MPIIYEINTGGDSDERFFASKERAIQVAREQIARGELETPVDIDRLETPPLTVDFLLGVLNSQGGKFVEKRQTVKTLTRGGPRKSPTVFAGAPSPEELLDSDRAELIETVGSARIFRYPTTRGRKLYAVGGVGFMDLEAARRFAEKYGE